MLNNGRDYSIVHIYVGEEWLESCPLDFPPRVGELIEMWGTVTDESGETRKLILKGNVVRVQHIIEKCNQGTFAHSWVQNTNVYLEESAEI